RVARSRPSAEREARASAALGGEPRAARLHLVRHPLAQSPRTASLAAPSCAPPRYRSRRLVDGALPPARVRRDELDLGTARGRLWPHAVDARALRASRRGGDAVLPLEP